MTEKKPIADKPGPKLEFAEDTDGVCHVNNKTLTVINTIAGGFNNTILITILIRIL